MKNINILNKIRAKTLIFSTLILLVGQIATVNAQNIIEDVNDASDFVTTSNFYSAKKPNDKYYDKQWYLKRIKANTAWDVVSSSKNIVIAVVDTGVQLDHPDLKKNIWINEKEIPYNGIDDDNNGFIDDINGWNFIENNNNPNPNFQNELSNDGVSHGTIIAGIIAAVGDNKVGVTGITWDTKIMPLKVLNEKGEGDTRAVINAIDYAIANEADIINFSFIGKGFSKSLDNAIKRAYRAGVVMVAAAGNEESSGRGYHLDKTPLYPVCHDGEDDENMIIGVSATDTLDQKTNFSGYGSKCVDISAPGVSIFGTSVFSETVDSKGNLYNKYYDGYWSGTSMAVPMVSATIALIEEINPSLNRDEVVDILKNSADNIDKLNPNYLSLLGAGRLNVYEAVKSAEDSLYNYSNSLLIAPKSDKESEVKITNQKGEIMSSIKAYDESFKGGVHVSSGDIDGDGINEIITGAGKGGKPHVKIFKQNGKLKAEFFAYAENFRGGVNVTVGDIDNDGIDEIITGAGNGGGPHVRIFNKNGVVKNQFFAYNENFRGGVNVAVGDVNGDGVNEIITGAGFGGGPQVRIFKSDGDVIGQFFAYNEHFRGGVNVAVGDVDGGVRNKQDEIITGAGFGGGPHIRVFKGDGGIVSHFFAYDKKFRGGVNLATGDVDHDGVDEIITAAGAGGGPHVRVFEKDSRMISSFYAYERDFTGGVNVGLIEL